MTFRGSLSALTISKSGLSLTPGDYFPPKRFKSAESQSPVTRMLQCSDLHTSPGPSMMPRALGLGAWPAKKSGVTNDAIVNGQLIKCHNNCWPATETLQHNERRHNIVRSVICLMIGKSLFPVSHKRSVDKQRDSAPWSLVLSRGGPGQARQPPLECDHKSDTGHYYGTL